MSHDFYTWSFVDGRDRTALLTDVRSALAGLEWSEGEPSDGLRTFRHDAVHALDLWLWPVEGPVGALVFSCTERVPHGPGLPHVLEALTAAHIAVGALRTVWGWELGETVPFDAAAEQARLRGGDVENVYWFDILRGALLEPSRREALRARATGTGCVFHALENGDALFRGRLVDLPGI